MTVPYIFAVMYTKGGIATAPSDTPTISVIDKDNNLLVNAQPAIKLSNLAGHCVYSYDGAVGLACWGQFHSTDTTLDQQDLGSAGIPYLITSIDESADAILVDTGTTLPATLANIDGDIADVFDDVGGVQATVDTILADTNEVQVELADGGRTDLLVDGIKAKTDNLPTDPADESTLEALINTRTTLGAGAITWVYNLKDNIGNNIADANIWVTSDLAGANVLASGITDANGNVTFYLDAGTVYVWGQKSGYNFTSPDTEVVS